MSMMIATMPHEVSTATVAQRGAKVPNLEQWRKRRLLTQRQLADAARVAPATIVRAESGSAIDLATIGRLASALRIEPVQLMNEGER